MHSIKKNFSFGFDVFSKSIINIDNTSDLSTFFINKSSEPYIVLGQGTNTLFINDFEGDVLVMRIKEKKVIETDDSYLLHIGAGEDWSSIVCWTIDNNMYGLENLTDIPGSVGAAPVQNIGAYGAEFKDFCQYVDYFCTSTMAIKRIYNKDCNFTYRNSIFKSSLKGKAIIVAVGIKLSKSWMPNLKYPAFSELNCGIRQSELSKYISRLRAGKLPNHKELGNAGSFFKNPIISEAQLLKLKIRYPKIVHYRHLNGFKVAAGWMIDNSGLRGVKVGGAQVYPKQALVLTSSNGNAYDVIKLAQFIYHKIDSLYQIKLEHEVQIVSSYKDVDIFSENFMLASY